MYRSITYTGGYKLIKLLKRFKVTDWLLAVVLVGVVVAQVYFDVTIPDYTEKIFNAMLDRHETSVIIGHGGTMLLFAGGSMICTIIASYIATYIATRFSAGLRRGVFTKVQSFSFEETNKFSTASLITRSTNDIQQVQMAVIMLLRMAISAPITAVWAILKISASSIELTFASAAWIVMLVVALISIFSIVLPKFKLVQKLTDKLNGVTRENLTGLRVVKAYNADEYEQEKFGKVNKEVTKVHLFVNRIMGLMNPLMMLVMNGISLTLYWFGASLINGSSDLDYAALMKFSTLVMQVLMAFMMLTMLFIMLPRASVSAKRINEVLDTKPTIHDPTISKDFVTSGEVEFKNVSFKYPDANEYVLKDINFKINKGQTVAFIGSTGSGKSTLINLIPRFFDTTEGEILVNGINIKEVSQQKLRSIIGYVPQKGVLFSGSVNSNISYGKDDLPQEVIQKSAVIAEADEFIVNMQDGYDADISQGGKNISGGQKQRLSIARAVAIDPEIFIFDDSFSALDYTTDKKVRNNLKKNISQATCLIVAQRIGTILDADMIIVLDNGEIVGKGTHKELIHNCEVYREIALSQLSHKELGI